MPFLRGTSRCDTPLCPVNYSFGCPDHGFTPVSPAVNGVWRLVRPAAKDKIALERLGTAARRPGTTPPPTSRCRPPHPCAHRDSGEGAVEGCTGNTPGHLNTGPDGEQRHECVKEHGRDDAPDEHARIRGPIHIDRFRSRRLRWDHFKSLPQVASTLPSKRGLRPHPRAPTSYPSRVIHISEAMGPWPGARRSS